VYLNELDQFVKRELRCRHYLRYVDDMVLLAPDPQTLAACCAAIEAYLGERHGHALRPELKTPFPVAKGLDFVGWRTWWNGRLSRRHLAARALGLRRTRLRRSCYAFTAGFPRRLCGAYLRRALGQRFKVVWIPQARPAMCDAWAWIRRPTRIHLPAAVGVDARRSKEPNFNPDQRPRLRSSGV